MAFGKLAGKKGLEFLTNWVAILFICILVLSFMLSVVVVSPWINYAVVAFGGVILGYFIYLNKLGNKFQYYVLSFALITGYELGLHAGSRLFLLLVFVAAIVTTVKLKQMLEA